MNMSSRHSGNTLRAVAWLGLAACLAALTAAGCAAHGRVVTYDQQLLREADSLFLTGNYEYAKIRYTKLRDDFANTGAGSRAQFNLGYINVFYENPFANWEAALREFKTFAEQYPNHELIEEVNSWIRILVVLQSFKREYEMTTGTISDLRKKAIAVPKPTGPSASYEILYEAVNRCYSERDSLGQKIRILEDVIRKIEATTRSR